MLGLVSAVRCFGFGCARCFGCACKVGLLRVFLVLDRWVVCVNCWQLFGCVGWCLRWLGFRVCGVLVSGFRIWVCGGFLGFVAGCTSWFSKARV